MRDLIVPLGDLAFLAYAAGVLIWVVRFYFWDDLKAWWRESRARREELDRLNKLWEMGGFD